VAFASFVVKNFSLHVALNFEITPATGEAVFAILSEVNHVERI